MPVLLGGENGALPIARSLARGKLNTVIVASERSDDPTFPSRYCKVKIHLERFQETTDARNVNTLVDLARSLQEKPVLFWGSDRETLFIHRNREVLGRWFRFVLPDAELTEILVDKGRFAAFAKQMGLPVPETFLFSNLQEILKHGESLPYPCTIKPVYMSYWYSDIIKKKFGTYKHTLRRLTSAAELEPYLLQLPNIDKGVVVQRFIEGRDEDLISFHAYINADGIPMACFVGRKIRTNPIHFGGSAYIETIHRPDFMEFCLTVCSKIGFTGVVKIDCKRDAVTGEYIILEFNSRFNLWEYLGATAGVNIPKVWYDDLCGKAPVPTSTYQAGRRWLNCSADLRALQAYRRAGEWTLMEWLSSYLAPKVYHTFDWRDPWPLVFSFPRFVKRQVGRWRLRITGDGGGSVQLKRPGALGRISHI